MQNENGKSLLDLDGGVLDLRDYPNPKGLTIYNNDTVVVVTGDKGEEPIMVLLPEKYAVE